MSIDVEACFLEQRARVYRWAYGMTRRHEDALDITQEVFTRMATQKPPLGNRAAAVGWLRRVTHRLVVDRWRSERARRERERSAPQAVSSPVEAAEAGEMGERLRAALANLSGRQCLVVIGKCFDGLTFAEIGEENGLALGTVKTHYLRALSALRDVLRAPPGAG